MRFSDTTGKRFSPSYHTHAFQLLRGGFVPSGEESGHRRSSTSSSQSLARAVSDQKSVLKKDLIGFNSRDSAVVAVEPKLEKMP